MQRKALLILAILALVAIILAVLPASGDPAFYVVSYDGNGTTVYVDEQAKYPGQDLVLADNKPTWRGHFFLGWAASPDAAAAEYQPGDTFTVDESTVLYAVWMDCADLGTVSGNGSYTVSYPITKRFAYVAFTVETSGKYVIRSTGEYYRNNSATTRLEYEGSYGYWTSDSIDKVNHDFERLFDLEAGKQYYLFYYHTQEPLQLEFLAGINTVSYDGNGTTVYVDEQAKYPGQDLVLADDKPTWRGHFFLGWAASPDATVAEYQPGDTFTADESTVLYAVWMDCADLGIISGSGTYTVSYPITKRFAFVAFTVKNSGKYVIRSTGEYYRNNSATTRLEYEDGYGYWTSDYIDKVNHDFERLFDLEAGKQYYLFYYHTQEPLQLEFLAGINTVSYDGNGTTVYVDEQAKYPGQDLVLADDKPTWRGHFFLGWAASPDAAAAEYQPGDTFTVDESTVLYAVWMDCADLGTVSGSHIYTISYPITKRFAFVAFTVKNSGKYVIRSTGEYYRNNSATTRLEYEGSYGYWTSDYIDKVNHDFEKLFDLEAGKQYYLFYYHTQEPLQLEIIHQYIGLDYQPDLKLPASITLIEAQAFAGSAFQRAEIPDTVSYVGSGAFSACEFLCQVLFRGENTEIEPDAFDDGVQITIIAPENSTAHQLAVLKGYEFVELEE